MSFVLISPEVVSAAAGDLANVGSTISAANKAAAAATTQVLAAGADEVSARIAALFGMYGLEYQAISAQVAAYHQQFVQTLRTGAASYMLAEATNVEQNLLNLINAPTQTLLGRPLIGDGANATTPGGAGGDAMMATTANPATTAAEAPPATRQRRRCGAPACARQIGAILTSQVITWFDSCRATVPAPQWMHTR